MAQILQFNGGTPAEGVPPDYCYAVEISFHDGGKTNAICRRVTWDEDWTTIFLFEDREERIEGVIKEPIFIVPMGAVKHIQMVNIERMVDVKGESVYVPVTQNVKARPAPTPVRKRRVHKK